MRSSSLAPSRSPRSSRRGFTLIELMVVIVILGLLIGLVGTNVWQMLKKGTNEAAMNQMANFSTAISSYKAQNRTLPKSLEELTVEDPRTREPFIDKIPDDPWGQKYEYRHLERGKFEISSWGEDKIAGTEDDLYYPERDTSK